MGTRTGVTKTRVDRAYQCAKPWLVKATGNKYFMKTEKPEKKKVRMQESNLELSSTNDDGAYHCTIVPFVTSISSLIVLYRVR